ncbi:MULTISPECIES: hypothetical protein [unclassified Leeuwenhoekiella]|mgnify:CR=1 FL=1|nr:MULTISPECIES: hypothetical protein [unclassified Leeuwenhoekiella]|tara:strand:- start:9506 stop:9640 length:135 start_codon:yes stop_codon:yes gene_type:complete
MSDKKTETKNDQKEEKDSIDKGPIKDEHVNQYGSTDDDSKKRRA